MIVLICGHLLLATWKNKALCTPFHKLKTCYRVSKYLSSLCTFHLHNNQQFFASEFPITICEPKIEALSNYKFQKCRHEHWLDSETHFHLEYIDHWLEFQRSKCVYRYPTANLWNGYFTRNFQCREAAILNRENGKLRSFISTVQWIFIYGPLLRTQVFRISIICIL